MQVYDEKTLSSYAQNVIQSLNYPVKYAEELKTWDGADEFGPELVLYDLYIIIDKSPNEDIHIYEYHWYHMEYYDAVEMPVKYHLEKTEYHNIISHELFTS
jgi:hypothetical protein